MMVFRSMLSPTPRTTVARSNNKGFYPSWSCFDPFFRRLVPCSLRSTIAFSWTISPPFLIGEQTAVKKAGSLADWRASSFQFPGLLFGTIVGINPRVQGLFNRGFPSPYSCFLFSAIGWLNMETVLSFTQLGACCCVP